MMTFEMTKEERREFLEKARAEFVDRMFHEHSEGVQTVSRARAAGILDVDNKTLDALKIPRVPLNGKLVKYKLSTIATWLADHEEK